MSSQDLLRKCRVQIKLLRAGCLHAFGPGGDLDHTLDVACRLRILIGNGDGNELLFRTMKAYGFKCRWKEDEPGGLTEYSLGSWLDVVCWYSGSPTPAHYTRKGIVEAWANRDGGVHEGEVEEEFIRYRQAPIWLGSLRASDVHIKEVADTVLSVAKKFEDAIRRL